MADRSDSPTAVVVSTHEHLPASAADRAVGLVAVVVVLVRTFQEAVLQTKQENQIRRGFSWRFEPPHSSSSYLTALAHSSGEQRVLQADAQTSTGDTDVCRQSVCVCVKGVNTLKKGTVCEVLTLDVAALLSHVVNESL